MTYYEENGEGGFTSDLSTSEFDFFFFVSFLVPCFSFLASFFADPLSFLAMVPAHCGRSPRNRRRALSRHIFLTRTARLSSSSLNASVISSCVCAGSKKVSAIPRCSVSDMAIPFARLQKRA